MKYFNEDPECINANCEKCGIVLKVRRENCSLTPIGYDVVPPAKCFCGNRSGVIFKSGKEVIANTSYSPAQNVPKCPTCGSINIQKISGASKMAKVALFGILAAGAVSKTFKCNNCGYQW